MVQPIEQLSEFKEIIGKDEFVVIDFWATWCGPCKVMSPIFEKLSTQYPHVKFFKVDVDTATDISEEVAVRAMPTFIVFKNGEKVKDVVGANPGALQAMLASLA